MHSRKSFNRPVIQKFVPKEAMLVVNNNKMQKVLSIATAFIGGEHHLVQACEFCGDDSCGMWDDMGDSDEDPAYRPYEEKELFADDFMASDHDDRYSGYTSGAAVRDYYPEDHEVPHRSSRRSYGSAFDDMSSWRNLFQGSSSLKGLFNKSKKAANKKAAVAIGSLRGDEPTNTPMDTALSFLNMGGASAVAVLNWDIKEEERLTRAQSPHRASVVSPSRAKLQSESENPDEEYATTSGPCTCANCQKRQRRQDDVIMGDFLTDMLDRQVMENPMGRGPKRQIRAEAEDTNMSEDSNMADVYLKGKVFMNQPASSYNSGTSQGYRRTIEL